MEVQELKALRRNLREFIRADPVQIVLTRTPKTATTNGSYVDGTPTDLPAQTFRLVPFKRRLTDQEANTQDGDIPLIPYVLVGHWDADVERDDAFTYQGRNCVVVGIEPKSGDTTSNDRLVVEFEMR